MSMQRRSDGSEMRSMCQRLSTNQVTDRSMYQWVKRLFCSSIDVEPDFPLTEKPEAKISNEYNAYDNQDDQTHRYHEQDADETDNDVYASPSETTTLPTTTTASTSTDLAFTEYNPSIDMGQYCGACRYYSRRLHFKKYCKRDYSKSTERFSRNFILLLSFSSYSRPCDQSTWCWSMGFVSANHCSCLQRSSEQDSREWTMDLGRA